jgi:hypothetical protein
MEMIILKQPKTFLSQKYELKDLVLNKYPCEGFRKLNYLYDSEINYEALSIDNGQNRMTLFNNEIDVLFEILQDAISERNALNGEYVGKDVICIKNDFNRGLTVNEVYTVEWDNGSYLKLQNDEHRLGLFPKILFKLEKNIIIE